MKESGSAPILSRDRARSLRASATVAEGRLWQHLRNRRLKGAKFRRQYPVGRYIVDFFCVEARLVVELDGGGHDSEEQRRSDAVRDRYLANRGYRVLRFWNNEVVDNVDGVLERIADFL
jgi:very-short-patch-repair endonuclease